MMTDSEYEHWSNIQSSSHKEKLEYLMSLTKPGKNYFITPHYHSRDAVKEFVDIIDIDLDRRAVGFSYFHDYFKEVWTGLNYTSDYEFIIWNGKMYRGYIETNVLIDDPEEFKRLTFDFHKYETEKALEVLG